MNVASNTFNFQGHTFEYFDHPHNNTRINERAVELPLVKYFLDQYPDCVEIGAVSPYYFKGTHEIYDLTDTHPRSKSVKAENIDLADKNLLSISTIEHFSRPDAFCSDDDPFVAPKTLEKWIESAKNYLISWPAGYHPFLDRYALENFNCKFISRRPKNTLTWEEVSLKNLSQHDMIYGNFHCANTVIIIDNIF